METMTAICVVGSEILIFGFGLTYISIKSTKRHIERFQKKLDTLEEDLRDLKYKRKGE